MLYCAALHKAGHNSWATVIAALRPNNAHSKHTAPADWNSKYSKSTVTQSDKRTCTCHHTVQLECKHTTKCRPPQQASVHCQPSGMPIQQCTVVFMYAVHQASGPHQPRQPAQQHQLPVPCQQLHCPPLAAVVGMPALQH